MGQTQTGLLILAIIVVLGSIAYTIQTIEERKRARKLLIMSLKSQIRNSVNIYQGLPDVFMTAELHEFISRFIISKMSRLLSIDDTEESRRSLSNFREKANNRDISLQHPEGSMSIYQDEGQVHHALGQLKEITRWLGELSKSRQISEFSFNELGWQTKDFYDRVSCDIEILDAIDTQKVHGEKAAFHKFSIAVKSLNNLNQSEALDSQIFAIHRHMEILKNAVLEQEQEAAEERAKSDEEEKDKM
ncbi:MAG: hypothetical protein OFPI_42390 [Osedax symbiont Rs2]|nr:MAG: hypothetical protein OFPI_42390 [Osedax symbiont Rs2]